IIMGYEDTYYPRTSTAQVIFGSLSAKGLLPVNAGAGFNYKDGIINNSKPIRLQQSEPEETGMSLEQFYKIDSIMQFAIDTGATPGAQILIAVDGKIIFDKNYGYHTYDSILPVQSSNVYDIASVTKIVATAMAMMKIYEEGKINLDESIVRYLPELKNTNKEKIKVRDMLAHQAGLISWIPFWVSTVEKGSLSDLLYKKEIQGSYCIRLSDDLYLKYDYPDEIWDEIVNSEMMEEPEYKYSDLGLIISKRIIERVTGMPFEDYLYENFYTMLDLQRFSFRPREKFIEKEIVPTELDTSFRNCLVWGDVHDPAAAMMEGVGGHAGLFSNSYSLACFMQLFLNGGEYAGTKYLEKNSIDVFTKRQFDPETNRRGLIFDKPEPDTSKVGPACLSADLLATSYGHSGFTGAYAWAEPKYNMVYVFLSNRIHPDANNRLLVDLNIRTEIQQVIYDALEARENNLASQ
ncbi:MAG: serine hydrolase, partial [Bacteroidia bacterium]|nr:serine hydrolase [Bacteroidia bacterium]